MNDGRLKATGNLHNLIMTLRMVQKRVDMIRKTDTNKKFITF